ncbi:sialic acid-binding Ig-like lectin 16 [Mixophyes fleayi]|uniref:sialic acid-binding Ig-like lectin 16 n=1 Tax=Mixophyes fleayi TaxID=3061075 RepID=UPI003F4DB7CD
MWRMSNCILQKCYTAILLVLPFLWKESNSQFLPEYKIQVPRKIAVQAGLCVHIPCTFTTPSVYPLSRNAKGIWYKEGKARTTFFPFYGGFEDTQGTREKLFLTGEVWKGNCSLRINDANPEDSGYYVFRFDDTVAQHSFIEDKPYVYVIELMDIPEISPVKDFVAGEKVTLTCTSPGRCSGRDPQITWEGNTSGRIMQSYTVNHEDGTRTYHSNITFIPSVEDDQSSLTCKVTYVSSGISRKSILLKVEDKSPSDTPPSDCRSMDSKLIAGIVAGNIIFLLLISLGLYYFLKRYMEKRLLGNGQNGQNEHEETEPTYQYLSINLIYLSTDIICQYPNGYSIQILNPSVTVEEGLCVTVPCGFVADYTTTFEDSKGLWMIKANNSIAASNKAVTRVKDNFHMTGDPDKGDCTLTITDARRDDIGEYYFRFEKSDGSPVKNSYNRHPISVTVTDLTQLPEISIPRKLLSGQEVTLTCSPPVNCSGTPPIFQWTKSNQNGIWKNSSTVIFTPSPNDHNQSITCEVTFPTVKKSTQKTVILDVHYPPSIKIEGDLNGKKRMMKENMAVLEGDLLTLSCSTDSNPAAHITWMKGEDNVPSNMTDQGLEIHLSNITTDNADSVYYCLAWNEYKRISKSVTITVQYPPRNLEVIISSSQGRKLEANPSLIINEGESLTVNCTVDGNPSAAVSWIKGEVDVASNNLIGRGSVMSLVNITSSEADIYRCLAWNRHGVIEKRIQFKIIQGTTSYCYCILYIEVI